MFRRYAPIFFCLLIMTAPLVRANDTPTRDSGPVLGDGDGDAFSRRSARVNDMQGGGGQGGAGGSSGPGFTGPGFAGPGFGGPGNGGNGGHDGPTFDPPQPPKGPNHDAPLAPEIDPGSAVSAFALLASVAVMLRKGRRNTAS
jgi:hypothetical protein